MMKKITRIAALLATAALLLAGFPACGDDDGDEEPTLEKIEISIAESVKLEYNIDEDFDPTGITVTATYSDGSTKIVTDKATFTATTSGGEFTTAEAGTYNVTLTATYEGKKDTATREITVKKTDTVTPASFELTSGADAESKTFTLTLSTTQINEAGLAALKEGFDLTALIEGIVSPLDDITVSKLVVAKDATATELELSLTMASAAAGGTKGTLTLTLPANFTKNGEAITGELKYEIKAAGGTGDDKDKPNPDDTSAFTSWTANLSAISTGLSGEKDSSTPPKVTVDAEKTVDTAFIIYSPSARIRVRDDNTLNYNGGTKDAFATTTVNGTLTETLDRYVGVDTSKLTSSGNVKVTISVKAVNSSSATGDVGQVVLVDENNKILAYHGDVKIKTGNDTFDIDATVAAGSKVIVGFSRSGAGGGGIDVTALKAEAAN